MEIPTGRRDRIAAELRAEMARQKVSVVSLSEATDIKVATLRNRLNGVQPFFVSELDSVCFALGLSLSEFITRTDEVA